MSNGRPENPGKSGERGQGRGRAPKHGQTSVSVALPTADNADGDGKVWLVFGKGDGADAVLIPHEEFAAHAGKPNRYWADPKVWTPPEPEEEEDGPTDL